MKDVIRTFIAIAIDSQVQREIGSLQEEIRQKVQRTTTRVSWVKPETIHLTLKFLGDIPQGQVGSIMDALGKAAAGIESFTLKIEGLGVFPTMRNPRVIWIGISEGKESLKLIQPRVEQELASIGFAKEKKRFNPHLTLGRIRTIQDAASLAGILAAMPHPVAGQSIVRDIRLMKSELHPAGAVHTELGRISLPRKNTH